jgi:tetratricopeptide (TPR) repeat protein
VFPHYKLSLYLKDQGKVADAILELQRAIELKHDSASFHYELGLLLERQHDIVKAVAEFRRGVELAPNTVKYEQHLGQALTELQARVDPSHSPCGVGQKTSGDDLAVDDIGAVAAMEDVYGGHGVGLRSLMRSLPTRSSPGRDTAGRDIWCIWDNGTFGIVPYLVLP